GMICPQGNPKNFHVTVLFFATPFLLVARKDLPFRVIWVAGENSYLMSLLSQSLSNCWHNCRPFRRKVLRDNEHLHFNFPSVLSKNRAVAYPCKPMLLLSGYLLMKQIS